MFHKEIPARPRILWLLCAMTAPAAQILAGTDFRLLGFMALACTAVVCLALAGNTGYGKTVSGLQLIWIAAVVGMVARYARESWPMGRGEQAVPLVLLALAAWSAGKGPAAAARTAGILFPLLCVGYGLIFAAGIPQIRPEWAMAQTPADPFAAVFFLLIPGTAASLPGESLKKGGLWLLAIPAFCVVTALVTGGSVHPEADAQGFAFFEMCRSLSLFGLAERFEALSCALVSVGWFSLLSLLLSCAGANAENCLPGKGRAGVWLASTAGAAAILGKMSINSGLLSVFGGLFWGFVPILAQGIDLWKNNRKK